MYAMVGLDNLKFPRSKLVDILKSNKVKHVKDWQAADSLHRSAIVKAALALSSAADACAKTAGDDPTNEVYRRYDRALKDIQGLKRPQNCAVHYDRAISMLELTIDNEIELSQVLYSQLVLDNWDWAEEYEKAKFSNSSYMGGR